MALDEPVLTGEMEGLHDLGCEIQVVGDVTGDGRPEVDLALGYNCWMQLACSYHRVFSAQGGLLRDVAPRWDVDNGPTVGLAHISGEGATPAPSGRALALRDWLMAPAGYMKSCTSTWAWNGARLALVGRAWDASSKRAEMLYDANFAFANGETATARVLYERVVRDHDLVDSQGWDGETPAMMRDNAQQFAAFRLVLASDPRSPAARSWSAWLRTHFPASPFARAATTLEEERKNHADAFLACHAVQLSIAGADLGPLSRMFKFVPTLGAEALCPGG